MISEEKKIEILNRWIGTPYRYMGDKPGAHGGVDCIHLVKEILREIGISVGVPNYPIGWRDQDPSLFDRQLFAFRSRWSAIHRNEIHFGDVVLIADEDDRIKHSGVIVDSATFVHVLDDPLGSVRIDLIGNWIENIKRFIRVK